VARAPRVAVGLAPQDAVVHQRGQPVRQHVAGQPQRVLEVVEAAHAGERLLEHEERPTVAEDVSGRVIEQG